LIFLGVLHYTAKSDWLSCYDSVHTVSQHCELVNVSDQPVGK
jgi:hypothetical protein